MARRSTKTKVKETKKEESYFDKLESEVTSNQSKLSLILGALIVLVVGVLLFNYFNRPTPEVGPSQQSEEQEGDVAPSELPGTYTVKEGDTLFAIAERYYNDGYKYTEIAKENNLESVDLLEPGQVLQIPRLETASASPEPSPEATPTPSPTPVTEEQTVSPGQKGGIPPTTTEFGPAITGDTYTVVEGDWLSTIAARAYGDVLAYNRLAEANNIQNPDLIFPGMVLSIPH